jgi:hypothetical protein
VLALAEHERTILNRAAATRDRLVLQELVTQARLGQEDIEGTVPFGAPGREPALEGARLTVSAIERRTPAQVDAAARSLRGAAGALEPHVTPVQDASLARLRAPAPVVR